MQVVESGGRSFELSTEQELQPLAVSVRYIARLLQSDEYACAQVVQVKRAEVWDLGYPVA